LRSHQDSLEELCLSFWELDDRTRESTYEFKAFKCLPSLSKFTSPNKLDCHMSCWPDIFLKESMHGEGWHEQTSRRPLNDQEADKWHNRLPSSLTDLIIREMDESPQSEHNIRVPWDLRQLANLINIRHELLPNLKTLDLVMDCGERMHGRQRYNISSRKVQLSKRASDNDDGFVFAIVSPCQYRRAHGNIFLTETDLCRTPNYWIRWGKAVTYREDGERAVTYRSGKTGIRCPGTSPLHGATVTITIARTAARRKTSNITARLMWETCTMSLPSSSRFHHYTS
jgi:hypothetical protein